MAVKIHTKSELYNPAYSHALRNKIEHSIEPKPIIILEGYLALYDERVRDLLNLKIYLDIPIEESTKRRSVNKFELDTEYYEAVLAPMYEEFVLSTKQYADIILDVTKMTPDEVFTKIENVVSKP